MASKSLWLFDNGHGGIIDGVYQTQGKRSPLWPAGTQLFEGEFNRAIVLRLMILCVIAVVVKGQDRESLGIPYMDVEPSA